jgi:hypothetical protein
MKSMKSNERSQKRIFGNPKRPTAKKHGNPNAGPRMASFPILHLNWLKLGTKFPLFMTPFGIEKGV